MTPDVRELLRLLSTTARHPAPEWMDELSAKAKAALDAPFSAIEAQLLAQVDAARSLILHACDLMTTEQVGQWAGVREWLERDTETYPPSHVEPLDYSRLVDGEPCYRCGKVISARLSHMCEKPKAARPSTAINEDALRGAMENLLKEIEAVPPKANDWRLINAYDRLLAALPAASSSTRRSDDFIATVAQEYGPEASEAVAQYAETVRRDALEEAAQLCDGAGGDAGRAAGPRLAERIRALGAARSATGKPQSLSEFVHASPEVREAIGNGVVKGAIARQVSTTEGPGSLHAAAKSCPEGVEAADTSKHK
jgi:hypothetical protein